MKKSLFLTSVFALLAGAAMAQVPYATGAISSAWPPSTGSPLGTGGVPDDFLLTDQGGGLWSTGILDVAKHGLTTGQVYEYKVAGADWANPNLPDNGWNGILAGPAGDLQFFLKTSAFSDGYSPEPNGTLNGGYIWNTGTAGLFVDGTARLVGSFVSELGGADWDPASPGNPLVTDAGAGTLGDNIWGVSFAQDAIPVGSYTFKLLLGAGFANGAIGAKGPMNDNAGGSIPLDVVSTGQTVSFSVNIVTGRYKVEVTGGAAPDPGYYARSNAWSNGFTAAEKLSPASGFGAQQKFFTVASPGNHLVRITQHDGTTALANYPGGNGYPFTTTVPNQVVLVSLDQNVYTDGFGPATNIVTVVGNDPRVALNTWDYVQPVGNWQGEFTIGQADGDVPNGDWNPNNAAFHMTETSAGSNIWTRSFTYVGGGAKANAEFKITAARAVIGDADWLIQMGGNNPDDGITVQGNNGQPSFAFGVGDTLHFTADSITGRSKVVVNGSADLSPVRPAYLSSVTEVSDWSLF